MKPEIALIGPGKVGCAIAKRLQMAGYPIAAIISRDIDRAADACLFVGCSVDVASTDLNHATNGDIILLAVPDDQIVSQTRQLADLPQELTGKVLIHFSGLHPASSMKLANVKTATLSIHPLLPFADRQTASERLSNCPCAFEGDDASLPLAVELIEAFSGLPFRLKSENKALYHASACIASNYLVTLLASAVELLAKCGIDSEAAISLLRPLVQSSIENVAKFGLEQGLTGPIVRGDHGTVETHLAALERESPHLLELYRVLGKETVKVAERSTRLSPKKAVEIQNRLDPPAE